MTLRDITCYYANGEIIHTSINGSMAEIKKYYENRVFNLGHGERDKMVTCVKVELSNDVDMSDDFKCTCGNNSFKDGFFACDAHGTLCEPLPSWAGRYKCMSCNAIYTHKEVMLP